MPINIISLLVILLLAGCATHQPGKTLAQNKNAEKAAWKKVKELSATECGAVRSPPARARAVEVSSCVTRLVKKHVLPHAAFPQLIMPSRAAALRIAKDYAHGKISAAEYKKRSEKRVKNERSSWAYLAHQRITSR